MTFFKKPIAYLERQDFTDDRLTLAKRKPIFVMFMMNRCVHCVNAKPEFQRLADRRNITCMVVQVDGVRSSERAIGDIISTIYPDFRGFPSYALFVPPDGRIVPYNGSRDADSMERFVMNNISRR